ncbi:MAG: hypothetical protein QOF53_768 [Nocardioidaceae bacterium]|nr:hypothetical protein [Nocardioidaceae bacterium]
MLTCIHTLGHLGAACVRVCVALLVGASLGLLLGPFAVSAALHYVQGTAVGADLSCCVAQSGPQDYLSTLRWAAQQLQTLPDRLSEMSS